MVSRTEALEIVDCVYGKIFTQSYEKLWPTASVSNNGLLTIVDDERVIMGFGILFGLTPTYEILSTVSNWNRLNMVGHYWLAEGSDNDNWSLVCGFKHIRKWESVQSLTIKLENVAEVYDTLLATSVARAENFGDEQPYWDLSGSREIYVQGVGLAMHLA